MLCPGNPVGLLHYSKLAIELRLPSSGRCLDIRGGIVDYITYNNAGSDYPKLPLCHRESGPFHRDDIKKKVSEIASNISDTFSIIYETIPYAKNKISNWAVSTRRNIVNG